MDKVKVWVDADACPVVIREIICRAADRKGIATTFVANHFIKTPPSKYIRFVQVMSGFDIADNEIVKRMAWGDMVITSDIPLADEVITAGGHALSPRGEVFTKENIKSRLNIRDFMETMRSSGVQTGGPPALSQTDRKTFADQLDRWLTKQQL